jgi:hypothetical protein
VLTEDDLKRMQDGFIEGSKKLLLKRRHIGPVGFVVTLHKHLDKLAESGYGMEFIDHETARVGDPKDDAIATLVIDLSMNWKKLYHAVLTVFPQMQSVLPGLLAIGAEIKVDDPYMRLMRPFMAATRLDEKDIIAATMRQICDKASAFASIFHSEAWQRTAGPEEDRSQIPNDLGDDEKSIEVLISTMETYAFARMITTPVRRVPSPPSKKKKRDSGKVEGFGEPTELIDRPGDNNRLEGRLMRFLKPQGAAP